MIENFLPKQYQQTNQYKVNHNYLREQFSDYEEIWKKIREVVISGDFTLGEEVNVLEAEFALISESKFAIAVGSGTDALFLSLKALDIDKGDEVITSPFTFYATIGAIVTSGAKPVFVDIGDDFNINSASIEKKITSKTKAILPIHWSGNPCDMDEITALSLKYKIPVVSDSCHAINATYNGKSVGSLGDLSCFSFHPLKNINVWGDGGIITTNSIKLAEKLRLLRNHGLVSRDECVLFAYNSRLDTVQAVVARHLMQKMEYITDSRIRNAIYFDNQLSSIKQIKIPIRKVNKKQVFHLYSVLCQERDELVKFLNKNDIDAKVHYSLPMHLQPAASYLGYKLGDFPVTEHTAKSTMSLPIHEFITNEQQQKVVSLIKQFYE